MKALRALSLTVPALILSLALALPALAQGDVPLTRTQDIPAQLEPWTGWVLHGLEHALCPPQGNDSNNRVCAYAGELQLDLDTGEFRQHWVLFAEQSAILPYVPDGSGASVWPSDVLVDGQVAVVADSRSAPTVLLEPGSHVIQGRLAWQRRPEAVQIPAATALVRLTESGAPTALTDLSDSGLLRLVPQVVEERAEDSFDARIFRLVHDGRPMEITTLLRLHVSGRDRTLTLENVLPPDSTPLAVDSPLTVTFQQDGGVAVQARAGSFDVYVTSRMEGKITQIGPLTTPFGDEFWSFSAVEELRVAEVRGVPAVDPQTTDIPDQWRYLPAYLVQEGAALDLEILHRGGVTETPDQLSVERSLWLDFDGEGLTAQDAIWGQVRREWTLTMSRPAELGRVSMDGVDQPIVLLGEDKLPGVELRQSSLSLTAESRYENFDSVLPSSGWERDVQSLSASLNLPPGWRLLAATGVDTVSDSWISRWDLLDIFLALIISLAVFRLVNPLFGVLTLLFFAIGMHEPGAPRFSWLFVLGSLAILRLFTDTERLKKWLWAQRSLLGVSLFFLVILALIALPFIFNQFRQGFYPQMESRYTYNYRYRTTSTVVYDQAAPAPMEAPGTGGGFSDGEDWGEEAEGSLRSSADYYDKSGMFESQAQFTYDPEAVVQTGPGLPDWSWRSVSLGWNGPVDSDQELNLWLLPPWANALLSFARAVLLLGVLVALADVRRFLKTLKRPAAAAAMALLALAPLQFMAPAQASAQDGGFPPQDLLNQLQQRLLEPEACFPSCLSSPEFSATLTGGELRLVMEIHAGGTTSAPLPMVSGNWQPREVLVDESPTLELYRRDQAIWVLLEPGVHRVVLAGPAPEGDVIQITLPLLPKHGRVSAPGWNVQGLGQEGQVQGSLRLWREVETPAAEVEGVQTVPPFLTVERRIQLGLEWRAFTVVTRATPMGEPVFVEIPLMDGESVLADDLEVKDGMVLVRMEANEDRVAWTSTLAMSDELSLTAPEAADWVETWILEAAPLWDVTLSGIPMARNLDDMGAWQPLWRPWPGESVTIAAVRPEAAAGATMTIDSVDHVLTPGSRLDDNALTLTIRSAKGGRYTLTLPQGADVQQFTLDGRDLPRIGDTPESLDVTLSPGVQTLSVTWRMDRDSLISITAPAIDLGHAAVNVEQTYSLPDNRWLLFIWGGPDMGPALLFWTYLAALILVAAVLGSIPYTPLRRWQWFVLALGLSQVGPVLALFTVGWLFALGAKRKHHLQKGWVWYDLIQVGLWILALIGLGCLAAAVTRGLLDPPGMQIAGNGSWDTWLHWTQDRVDGMLPQPTVISLPVIWYRIFMLLWSLWLAISLLAWIKWGWECVSEGGIMRGPKTAKELAAKEPQSGA